MISLISISVLIISSENYKSSENSLKRKSIWINSTSGNKIKIKMLELLNAATKQYIFFSNENEILFA